MLSVNDLENSLHARATKPALLLERFWRIQDDLNRLLASCNDEPSSASTALVKHQGLIMSVLQVFKGAPRNNAAIVESCKNINELLLRIDFLRQKVLAEQSATQQ